MIKKEDLIVGKCYIFHYKEDYLVKYLGTEYNPFSKGKYYNPTGSFRFKTIEDGTGNISFCYCKKEATHKESQHLNVCIKANKYVEPETINNKIIEIW